MYTYVYISFGMLQNASNIKGPSTVIKQNSIATLQQH